MTPDLKAKWVAALRSGEYRQGRTQLRQGASYCCLGVLGCVAGLKIDDEGKRFVPYVAPGAAAMYPTLAVDLGVDGRAQARLMAMNDDMDDGATFPEIADWIERYL